MRLYLGPFEWRERISSKTGLPSPAGVFGWRMPVGAVQAIDFRGPQGAETPGARSPAQAIFVTPDDVVLPAPWVQLASDPAETLSAANRLRLRTAFQRGAVAARRFVDVLHELSTGHAEVDRSRCAPPRIASRDGKIKWLLGGQVVGAYDIGIGSPEWAGLVARHRAVYRALRLAGGVRHLKYLATLLSKYRLSEAQAVDAFIPGDLPREAPVDPETTYTESFPGTSSTLGGDQTWTEVSGTWANVSGVGSYTSDANTRFSRCESALSTDDMRVEVSVLSSSAQNAYRGPTGRFAAAASTMYSCISRPEINDYYGQRITAGSSSDIITSELSGSITLPSTDAVVIDGDEIEIFQGANSRGSTTDTNITGNLRGGLGVYAESLTVTFDSWLATDLHAGQTVSVNQAAESDSAQAIAVNPRRRLVAQGQESDAAQAITRRKAKALAQPAESDAAQAVAHAKRRTLGAAAESDSAQAIARRKTRALAQAQQSDAAQAVAHAKRKALGQPAESDSAQTIARRKTAGLSASSESDAAQAITVSGSKIIALDQAAESDAAQPAAWAPQRRLVNAAQQSDAAQAVAHAKRKALGQPAESDSAQAIARRKTAGLGQSSESDAAQAVSLPGNQVVPVGQAAQADSAQPLGHAKRRALGQAGQGDAAQSVTTGRAIQLGLVLEIDLSQTVAWAPKQRQIAPAAETDAAGVLAVIAGSAPPVAFDARHPRGARDDGPRRTADRGSRRAVAAPRSRHWSR